MVYNLRRSILSLLLLAILFGTLACKTRKKDCRGKRKTIKTEMGGWL
jgi:hypothetical protein